MAQLTFMRCWVRSGGTLLNRCLGAHPQVVILSEVHPSGGGGKITSVRKQAKDWFGIQLTSTDFYDSLAELAEVCKREGKYLIVREYTRRSYQGKQDRGLNFLNEIQARFDVRAFAFIRNPIDVLLSFHNNPRDELLAMSRYALDLQTSATQLFRYESFCTSPEDELERIMDFAEIPFVNTINTYTEFQDANGDFNYSGGISRGLKSSEISLLPRRYLNPLRVNTLYQISGLQETCDLLGYNANYYDPSVQRESYSKAVGDEIKSFVRSPINTLKWKVLKLKNELFG